jgi:hypothetical protein
MRAAAPGSFEVEDKAASLAHPSWPQNGRGLLRPSDSDPSTSKHWQQGVGLQPVPGQNPTTSTTFPLLPVPLPPNRGIPSMPPLGNPLFPIPPPPIPFPITPSPSFIDADGVASGAPVSDIAAQWQAMLMIQTQMRLQQQQQQGVNPDFFPMAQFDLASSSHLQHLESRSLQDATHRLTPQGKEEAGKRSQRTENKTHVEGFIMQESSEDEAGDSGSGWKEDEDMDGTYDGRADNDSSSLPRASPAPSAVPHRRKSSKQVSSRVCANCWTNKVSN